MVFSVFSRDITIRRQSGGGYVNGKWQSGSESNITIKASVQAASGEDLQSLEEGRRSMQSLTIYTDEKLETVDSQNPDKVTLFGEEYEIITVEPYQSDIISHYKCIAQRRNVGDSS